MTDGPVAGHGRGSSLDSHSIDGFGFMIARENKHRLDAYAGAIQQNVTPASIVFKIGTG